LSGPDFWTRRRAGVAAQEAADQAALDAAQAAADEAELNARSDEDILAEHNLPDPDSLQSPEEVRAFLSEALPQRLKARALRRLWRLNPVLANIDGLVDYGEDFTDSANVIENMQTAYQVGKGMLSHIEALAAEAERKAAANEPRPAEDDLPPEAAPKEPAAPAEPVILAEGHEEAETAPVEAPRRRMRFQFEAQA